MTISATQRNLFVSNSAGVDQCQTGCAGVSPLKRPGLNRRPVPADDGRSAAQSAAALQRLPNRSGGRGDRRATARQHALGARAVVVEQAAQRAADGNVQRAGRDRRNKPVFRDAFKRTRCLIPMSGYYEWQNTPGGKQPWYFTARDGSPLLTAAGLWDEWKNRETGERLKSCTMIVTEPSDFVAEIHDRMPVFLDGAAIRAVAKRGGGR